MQPAGKFGLLDDNSKPVTDVEIRALAWEGSTLYMANDFGILYAFDKDSDGNPTGSAIYVGSIGISSPTDLAWFGGSSIMYAVDDSADALYAVTGLHPFLPNQGDLYYNGSDFADSFLRWDNPAWVHDDGACSRDVTECSTYEHDLILEWSNTGGWFNVPRTKIPGTDTTTPGHSTIGGIIIPYIPGSTVNEAPADLFCTSWSDFPEGYDDCETSGVAAQYGTVELSFGTFKAPSIVAGRNYYGFWLFKNQRSGTTSTSVKLYGAEGEYKRGDWRNFECLQVEAGNNWCVGSMEDHKTSLIPDGITWTHGTQSYKHYSRP